MSMQAAVKKFHETFGLAIQETPGGVDWEVADLRINLIKEEVREAIDAMIDVENGALPELAHLAKELADLVYVTYGTAVTYGIDLDEVFKIVHNSNMSKLDNDGQPIFREDGKVLKGPNYWEAEPLILKHMELEMTEENQVEAVEVQEADAPVEPGTDVVLVGEVAEGDAQAEQPQDGENTDATEVSTDGDATESAEAADQAS